jgi:integrase
MSRNASKLNALAVQRAKETGRYPDGGGLYLQVSSVGTKAWLFRFTLAGRAREMGLGSIALVSLAEARAKALECRKLLHEGIDPIEAREARRKQQALASAKTLTFGECAKAYIESHRAGWKNAKHAAQWASTLETYAGPTIGRLPVQAVDTGLVMRVLEPLWREKAETASRLRSRIEIVLDWATVRGYRAGDNPARWRGHLDKLLPKRSSVKQVEHHPALPLKALSTFVTELQTQEGIAPRALEFLILTAARTGEVIGARWNEFDLAERVWIIPASRMKAKREHRVPLSPRAIEILETMRFLSAEPFVFPGLKTGKPLSNMALLAVLKRMKYEITSHGFRSTFRDWAAERTNFPREVAEAALAHTLKDKVEAAYRRGDLFIKRQRMMNEWAKFCADSTPAAVVRPLPIRGVAHVQT